MEGIRSQFRIGIAVVIILAMLLSLSVAPVFATAPKTEHVKYLGAGGSRIPSRRTVQKVEGDSKGFVRKRLQRFHL